MSWTCTQKGGVVTMNGSEHMFERASWENLHSKHWYFQLTFKTLVERSYDWKANTSN